MHKNILSFIILILGFHNIAFAVTAAERARLDRVITTTEHERFAFVKTHHPGLIEDNHNSYYGGAEGRALFEKHTPTIINQIVSDIRNSRTTGPMNFASLLKRVGVQRNWLAKKIKDPDAQLFGQFRSLESLSTLAGLPSTGLDPKLIAFFNVNRTGVSAIDNPEWYYLSKLKLAEFLSDIQGTDKIASEWVTTEQSRVRFSILDTTKSNFLRGFTPAAKVQHINKSSPDELFRLQDSLLCPGVFLENYYTDPSASDFLRGKEIGAVKLELEVKIGDHFVPMTKEFALFIWDRGSPNGVTEQSLESFIQLPYIMAIHTMRPDIQIVLDNINHLWNQALQWDATKNSPDELKQTIAEISYKLAHTMPFDRGSASIAEWIIQALYQFHGYKTNLVKWKSVDSQSFGARSLDAFITDYMQAVQIYQST